MLLRELDQIEKCRIMSPVDLNFECEDLTKVIKSLSVPEKRKILGQHQVEFERLEINTRVELKLSIKNIKCAAAGRQQP